MKIHNLHKLSFFFILLSLTSCANYTTYNSKDSTQKDSKKIIVSRYQGGVVTLEEAKIELNKVIAKDPELNGISFDDLNNDQKELIIKEVIINELSVKEAKKRNLDQDEDYKKAVSIFTTELLKQKLISNLTDKVTKEDYIKSKYDELAENLKDKQDIRIRYIALNEEKEANNLYNILKNSPATFSSHARTKSIDKTTAKKGGDLGFVLRDSLPAPIAAYTKNMKQYEISKPIAVGDKWFIVKLSDERPAKVEPFEKVKDSLAKQLAQKEVKDFVSDKIEKSKIKFFLD